MSKRSRRRSQERKRDAQRGNFIHTATSRAAHYYNPSVLALEDRRFYAPVETYPRAQFHRSAVLTVSPNVNVMRSKRNVIPPRIKFAVPKEVSLCVRRKVRRSVLFAKRLSGKGSRARKRHRNAFSSISC